MADWSYFAKATKAERLRRTGGFKEPSDRIKKEKIMKGKREMVWAVVISAGLILGCDGDGAPCQAACEKLSEYRIFEEFKNGPKGVEECVEQCKEELVEHEEETVRAINCTMDNNSRDEIIDCLLKR